jgi:hypothetical protein
MLVASRMPAHPPTAQVGRGLRQHPGKSECIVLDAAGNYVRHGPVTESRLTEWTAPAVRRVAAAAVATAREGSRIQTTQGEWHRECEGGESTGSSDEERSSRAPAAAASSSSRRGSPASWWLCSKRECRCVMPVESRACLQCGAVRPLGASAERQPTAAGRRASAPTVQSRACSDAPASRVLSRRGGLGGASIDDLAALVQGLSIAAQPKSQPTSVHSAIVSVSAASAQSNLSAAPIKRLAIVPRKSSIDSASDASAVAAPQQSSKTASAPVLSPKRGDRPDHLYQPE